MNVGDQIGLWTITGPRVGHRILIDGREHTLQEVGEMAGVSREAIRLRIKAGWSVEDLLLARGTGPAPVVSTPRKVAASGVIVSGRGRPKQHGLAHPLHAFWSHTEAA